MNSDSAERAPPGIPHPIWKPLAPRFTNIEVFRRMLNRQHSSLDLKDYHDLFTYSVNNYEFWMDIWKYFGIIYSIPPLKVLDSGPTPERPSWFPGSMLNYAENILRRDDDSIACTSINELGVKVDYSTKQLRYMVAKMAAALKAIGIVANDRIAAIATNSITAIVVALAAACLGALYTCSSPEMGAKGILDRYQQIRPKILFTTVEYCYAGKTVTLLAKIADIVQGLSEYNLSYIVLLPSPVAGGKLDVAFDNLHPCKFYYLSDFLRLGEVDATHSLTFLQLPFDHPLYILYSSGTTGAPKCIVHSAGGVLLQTLKDIHFCHGVDAHDSLLQYTTTGWMMWNFMLAAIPLGSRLILYDGSPLHPTLPHFLEMVKSEKVSVLGVSPRFLAELRNQEAKIRKLLPFEALRTVASGGAVLTASLHRWAQDLFGEQTRVMTGMGGTDICSAFATSVLSQPVFAGEISCKALGMKVEVFNPDGKNIEATEEVGELVCTRPHPSIPLGFWSDPTGKVFNDTYFNTYPGVWKQGDLMAINPVTKGLFIVGRSDGVLNPNGIRFGSGEIYSALEKFNTCIEDSLCVGQRRPQDLHERVLLFVKMQKGFRLTSELIQSINQAIQENLSQRHIPAFVFEVEGIPYTINGKKIEVMVKEIVNGKNVLSSGTVINPASLEEYKKFFDLEKLLLSLPELTAKL
ncbi:acetoacetate-CoA ligase [Cyathus striatus]|nr:acetoacetate-CoA ligase [Cyathus striatus]